MSIVGNNVIMNCVPYEFSNKQMNAACFIIGNTNENLVLRVARSAFHVIFALSGYFVETLLLVARRTYVSLFGADIIDIGFEARALTRNENNSVVDERPNTPPFSSEPLPAHQTSESIAGADLLLHNGLSTLELLSEDQGVVTSPVREEAPSLLPPLAQVVTNALNVSDIFEPSNIASPTPFSGSLSPYSPPERNMGFDVAVWKFSINPITGEKRYSLRNLQPLRFHKTVNFVSIKEGEIQDSDGRFSLSRGTHILYTGNVGRNGDLEYDVNVPAIRFECEALNRLIENPGLCDSIPDRVLHCSPDAAVNLDVAPRKDYVIHEGATSYRFVYPLQLHPEKANLFIERLIEDDNIPSFLKGLFLIGGYAYYDQDGTLLQVKALSASPQATEVLATGKALSVASIKFPANLLEKFRLGINMTSGKELWANQPNLLSPYANRITAPTLKYLSHFAYVPESLYEHSPETFAAAPFGGFLYKTKAGKFQFVPIGGEFVDSQRSLADRQERLQHLSLKEIEQYNKQKIFANVFYSRDSQQVSDLMQLQSCFRSVVILNNTSLAAGEAIVRLSDYEIVAAKERKITIRNQVNNESMTAIINEYGEISNCSNMALFRHLFDKVQPLLIKDMVKNVRGEIYTTQESIEFAPIEHVKVFIEAVMSCTEGQNPFIRYLDLNERSYVATDAGGVLRDYVYQLFSALLRNSGLFQEISPVTSSADRGLFELKSCNSLLSQIDLEAVGFFLGWVAKKSGAFPTGQRLAPLFFERLYACLKVPILSSENLLDIAVLDATFWEKKLMDYLRRSGSQLPDASEVELINALIDQFPQEASYRSENSSIVINDANLRAIKIDLTNILLEKWNAFIPLANGFKQQIPLIGEVGIRTGNQLNQFVQGIVNREKVVKAISYQGNNQSVQTKTKWIKEWILDPTTKIEEVLDFLRAVSGTTALGSNRTVIHIIEKVVTDRASFPVYRTCFLSIVMPYGTAIDGPEGSHYNKEKFLESFKKGIRFCMAETGFSIR